MSQQLKSCPFCSSTRLNLHIEKNSFATYYAIQCKNCGGSGGHSIATEYAIDNWNKRASDNQCDHEFVGESYYKDIYNMRCIKCGKFEEK